VDCIGKYSVIGVDVEHNRTSSYDGFCCLIQLSVFNSNEPIQTYIFDILQEIVRDNLHGTLGQKVLNNPKIVKILHGCLASDIVWLQRDFGI
jgi:ribonuclease D